MGEPRVLWKRGPDSVEWRQRPAEHMVLRVDGRGPLERPEVRHVLHHHYGGGITPRVGVSSNASITWFGDDRRTTASRSTDFTVEGYWQIVFRRSPATTPAMRAFIRYARQSSLLHNFVFGVPSSLRSGWTINSGINVSVF